MFDHFNSKFYFSTISGQSNSVDMKDEVTNLDSC